jgi:tRNA 2-thiouridine synthesizing protein A
MTEITERLDTTGMNCPLPILKTRKAINQLASGDVLAVTATDPGSVKDMASFCSQTGNRLVSSHEADSCFIFLIEGA